jgi:hypothetical protein
LREEFPILSQNYRWLAQCCRKAMILPMARQGGVNSRTGVQLQEHSGDRSLRPSPMDQNVKESLDSGPQNRRHPVLAWQPGADEGSPSSIESIAVGDLVLRFRN